MRVLHINTEKGWRGGERQTLLTASEQRRQGVETCIACRRNSELEAAARAESLPVLSLPAFAPAAIWQLRRAARKYDVLHSHTGRAHSQAALARCGHSIPVVVSRRTDFLPKKSRFNQWKYAQAEAVVCVSARVSRDMAEWGVSSQKLSVIYEAVSATDFLSRDEARRKLLSNQPGWSDKTVVGNIAALVPDKDHTTLLRAAQLVCLTLPRTGFVVIGDGPLKSELHDLRLALGLQQDVLFPGFLPEAHKLMRAFDTFVLSSKREGLGTILLDAAMASVPVAATSSGGIPENVLDGKTGLLAPAGDYQALAEKILRLLKDAELSSTLAQTGLQRAREEFSLTKMAGSYIALYKKLLAAKP
jgi:L-malate glycosyltransferase